MPTGTSRFAPRDHALDSMTQNRLYPFAAFFILASIFHIVFSPFFEASGSAGNGVGHDYALALPALLDGYYWYLNNGFLTPPWFSPAFCAGQLFYADPQSIFYSPIQFLTFFFQPLQANYLALLIAATVGYWGMYVFCRYRLNLTCAASTLAAALWMFNGFSTHHHIVGHVGFLHFYFAPLLAWLLTISTPFRFRSAASRIGAAGLILASCLHAGLGSLMIPLGLAVWALSSLTIIRGTPWKPFYVSAISAAMLATGIAASKIAVASAVLGQFPRAQYPLPGISSLTDLLKFTFTSLFLPEEEDFVGKATLLTNRSIGIGPHELAFDLTLVPVVIALGASIILLARKPDGGISRPAPGKRLHLILLGAIVSIPLAMLYYTPEWNAVLKQLPVIKSTSSPWRWLVLLSPIICAGCAQLLSQALGRQIVLLHIVATAALIALVGQKMTVARDYYDTQSYDPSTILEAYRDAEQPGYKPEIVAIGTYQEVDGSLISTPHQNDLIAIRVSQAFCYNPLFGYGLENFDARTLRPGNPMRSRDGILNLKNPACYAFPKENNCTPGDHFKDTDTDRIHAKALLGYRPWNFDRSATQKIADIVSQISLVIALLLLVAGFRLRRTPPRT